MPASACASYLGMPAPPSVSQSPYLGYKQRGNSGGGGESALGACGTAVKRANGGVPSSARAIWVHGRVGN